MGNAGLDETQAGIKIAGRNINNLRYTDKTAFMAESEEELKSLLMKVIEESENGLKLNIQKTKIMASSPIISWQIDGETVETVGDFIFGCSKITADGDCSHEIKRHLLLRRKAMTKLDSVKKERHYFASKDPSSQSYGFPSSHVWMWALDHKEGEELEDCCFWIVVLEKTLESPLDCKEIKPVNPKGNQPWIFIGRTDAEAETPILWPPDAKKQTHWKRPWCWQRWGQKEKGATDDEMVGWHHQLNGHGLRKLQDSNRDIDEQGRLTCCSPWSRRGQSEWTTTICPSHFCTSWDSFGVWL